MPMGNLIGYGAAQGAASGAAVGSVVPGIGTGIGAAVGGVAGAIGGLFGGGGSTSQGYTLPPEYELQMLQQFQQYLDYNQSLIQRNDQMLSIYDDRINTIAGRLNNTIPSSDALRRLSSSTQSLVQLMGGNAADLVKNGYLDAQSARDIEAARAVSGTTQANNPALLQQQEAERRKLEQDLARQGVSPAQRANALYQLDQQHQSQNFQFNQQNYLTQIGAAGQIAGIRQQGYNQALGTAQLGQQQLGAAQQGLGLLANIRTTQAGVGQQGLQLGGTLNQQNMEFYKQLGQFDLSRTAKDALSQGYVGPGSVEGQTGAPSGWLGTAGGAGFFANPGGQGGYGATPFLLEAGGYRPPPTSFDRYGKKTTYQPSRSLPGISRYFNRG